MDQIQVKQVYKKKPFPVKVTFNLNNVDELTGLAVSLRQTEDSAWSEKMDDLKNDSAESEYFADLPEDTYADSLIEEIESALRVAKETHGLTKLINDRKLSKLVIDHWIRAVDGEDDITAEECAYCIEYGDRQCESCPVHIHTGCDHCSETPYNSLGMDTLQRSKMLTLVLEVDEALQDDEFGQDD